MAAVITNIKMTKNRIQTTVLPTNWPSLKLLFFCMKNQVDFSNKKHQQQFLTKNRDDYIMCYHWKGYC